MHWRRNEQQALIGLVRRVTHSLAWVPRVHAVAERKHLWRTQKFLLHRHTTVIGSTRAPPHAVAEAESRPPDEAVEFHPPGLDLLDRGCALSQQISGATSNAGARHHSIVSKDCSTFALDNPDGKACNRRCSASHAAHKCRSVCAQESKVTWPGFRQFHFLPHVAMIDHHDRLAVRHPHSAGIASILELCPL